MIINCGKFKIYPKNIIILIILLSLVFGFLTDEIGLTKNIRFINDLLIIYLLISILRSKRIFHLLKKIKIRKINTAIIIFTLVNLISFILGPVPLNLLFWAIRNTYRFIVFFYACIIYLNKKDIDKIFKYMFNLQFLNIILVCYQYFILGLRQDFLGGIFGHGANAGLLIYNIMLLTFVLTKYLAKQLSITKMLYIFISTSIISVLAEIRVFFFLIIIIVLVNLILNKNLIRKSTLIISSIILVFVTINIYSIVFPYVSLSIVDLFNEGISTGGGYNISRLNAFYEINELFFKDSILRNLIGYGFGNCEYSSISVFTSDFYNLYGHFNYRWFTHQWVFLETGYLGIISFIFIFISTIVYSFKYYLISNKENNPYTIMTIIIAIISIITIFYNSLLKADFGYLAYFGIAISIIVYKTEILSN